MDYTYFHKDKYDLKCHEMSHKAHLANFILAHLFINRFWSNIRRILCYEFFSLKWSSALGHIGPLLCYGEDAWLYNFKIFSSYDNLDWHSLDNFCPCFIKTVFFYCHLISHKEKEEGNKTRKNNEIVLKILNHGLFCFRELG